MKRIPDALTKPYNPSETEARLYDVWEKSGYFNPDNLPGERKNPYTVILPPPNVTGTLHTGHAIMLAIQDTLVRYKRMDGYKTLWLPGTDHAAIATQSVVEKKIQKEEGKSRHDLGREEMLRRINEFALDSQKTILSQFRSMGASLDWSRLAFTIDDTRNKAVKTMFKKMYDDGLIYQGHRIVNWDPKGQTTISDDELVYVEEKTKFYYFKYGPFTIGTARPETKFGDKYVVMHPNDARYKKYTHGQKLTVEWINGPIEATIIKDESVDPEFGTGVMTITPWHSVVDFELAQKYKLDYEQIIDKYGKLLPVAGEDFAGMKIKDAREKIVEKLQAKGLVEKIEDYTHNISTAERSGGTVEPQIMKQWFVAVNKPFKHFGKETTLKNLMRNAVESKETAIIPDRFEKIYFHWIENLRDWCISRQIWYGHRIPVWYKDEEIYVGVEAPTDAGWVQDEDTLDTWFSSGMWTFSTLGWPEHTKDLDIFHPTAPLFTHDLQLLQYR
jgi:valyl-tRNA synthetase